MGKYEVSFYDQINKSQTLFLKNAIVIAVLVLKQWLNYHLSLSIVLVWRIIHQKGKVTTTNTKALAAPPSNITLFEKGNDHGDSSTGVKAMVRLTSLPINSAMTNNTAKGQGDHNYQHHQGIVSTTSIQDNSSASPYEYVWIIGTIHENRLSYKGFLWDLLISASLVLGKKAGSTAELWWLLYLQALSQFDTTSGNAWRWYSASKGMITRNPNKVSGETQAQILWSAAIWQMLDVEHVRL